MYFDIKHETSILFYSDMSRDYDDLCKSQPHISVCAQLNL